MLGDDFTDHEAERADIARSRQTPRVHMVVSGLRQMGKTSILLAVRNELIEAGHPVVYVDLWTASTPEDMTTRLTKAATATLGRRRTELVAQIGQRLRFNLEFGAGRLVSRRRD